MSMILDALQRADRERRKEEAPAATLPPVAPSATQTPRLSRPGYRWIGLILLVAVLAALTARWLLTRPEPGQPEAATSTEAPLPEPLDTHDAPATEPRQPGIERLYQAPSRPPPPDDSVVTLYRQTKDQQTQTPEQTTPTPDAAEGLTRRLAPPQERTGIRLNDTAAETPPSPETSAPDPEPSSATRPSISAIRDLSWNLQQEIPSLNYQAHQYQDGPGQTSTVTINQREYRVGDQIAPDLRVERIDEDGVVLSFKGHTFKLQALNSWINM